MLQVLRTIALSLILVISISYSMENDPHSPLIIAIMKCLYNPPRNVNFDEAKKLVSQLGPETNKGLNTYEPYIDGNLLDLVHDRQWQFGYSHKYNEIAELLQEKGAHMAPVRHHTSLSSLRWLPAPENAHL